MSSSSTQKQKEKEKQKEEEESKRACGCCGCDDLSLKNCSGCGSVAYCNAVCQAADWPKHKTDCNKIKKEKKAQEKAKEAVQSSGSQFADMGSIMAALLPPPQPQRYDEADIYNACFDGHHEELQIMLRQRTLDFNWADPEDGMTAAYISADKGFEKMFVVAGAESR